MCLSRDLEKKFNFFFLTILTIIDLIGIYNFSGYYDLRVQANGSALPYPRVLDINIFLNREIYRVDENDVLLLPFGQLIAHDISGLPSDLVLDENGKSTFYNYLDFFHSCKF